MCGPGQAEFLDHLPTTLACEPGDHDQPSTDDHTPLAVDMSDGIETACVQVAARVLGLTGPQLDAWVRRAKAEDERARDHWLICRRLAEFRAVARVKGVRARAADQGIPDAWLRVIIARLVRHDIGGGNLVSFLDYWIERARIELDRDGNHGVAFDAAWREAKALFNIGPLPGVTDHPT